MIADPPTFVTHLECSMTGERYDADIVQGLSRVGLRLVTALVDGQPAEAEIAHDVTDGTHRLTVSASGTGPLASIGLRFAVEGAARYLRNGYHS